MEELDWHTFHKMRKTYKKLIQLLIIGTFALITFDAVAQVNWQFQIGGMYSKKYGMYGDLGEKSGSGELTGAILVQIPVKQRFFIETGLGWRHKLVLTQADGFKFNHDNFNSINFDSDFADFIELPIKAGYKLRLNEKNAFDFGFGPYLSVALSKPGNFNTSAFSAGLNASVAFRHRCMSFGLSWQNPIFKNGLNDYYKNSIMVTIGINIRGRKPNWDKIIDGLSMAGSALQGASQVASAFASNSQGSYNYGSQQNTAQSVYQQGYEYGQQLLQQQEQKQDLIDQNNPTNCTARICKYIAHREFASAEQWADYLQNIGGKEGIALFYKGLTNELQNNPSDAEKYYKLGADMGDKSCQAFLSRLQTEGPATDEQINNIVNYYLNIEAATYNMASELSNNMWGDISSGSSSSKKSASEKANCQYCHGSGYDLTPYEYSADMKSYLNSAGNKCRYCGKTTKHYHYPCHYCK